MPNPTIALSQASCQLGFLIWTATSSGIDRQFIAGDPGLLLGVTGDNLNRFFFDDDWPTQAGPTRGLRRLMLQKARAHGEARCRYAVAVGDDVTCWLEERVRFQDDAWNGMIHRLTLAESPLVMPPALARMVRQLFDPLPDGVFLARRPSPGATLHFVYGNPALLEALHRTPDTWQGQRPEDLFSREDGQRLQRHLAECEQSGQAMSINEILHHGEHQLHWRMVLTVLESDNTATPFVVGTIRDHTELEIARRSAANAHRRLRHLLETSPAVLYACHPQPPWELNHISRNLSRLLGLDTDAEKVGLLDRVHPDDVDRLCTWLKGFTTQHRERRTLRYRLRHSHGHYLTIQNEARISRPIREGATPELVGTLLDVSREAELLARLEIMTEHIPGLIFQFRRDPHGRYSFPYLAGNDQSLQTIDPRLLAEDARLGLERICRDDLPTVMAAIEHSARHGGPLSIQFRLLGTDAKLRWVTARAQPERQDHTGATLWHGVLLDISDQIAQETRLRELTGTDELTGLANRRRLNERLNEEMSRARRHRHTLTLILLDLDHFKRINDTWGHLAGDQVLQGIGRLCLDTLRQEDVIARLGGEEFAILLPLTRLDAGQQLAERLRQCIEAHDFGLGEATITASLGVAECRADDDIETLLDRADRSLYTAKRTGRNRVVIE